MCDCLKNCHIFLRFFSFTRYSHSVNQHHAQIVIETALIVVYSDFVSALDLISHDGCS